MTEQHSVKLLKDYQPADFLIKKADLYFELNEDRTIVKSELLFERNITTDEKNKPLILDGENLDLISIALNGNLLSVKDYKVTKEKLLFENVPDIFTLKIQVAIKPQENTKLMGLYKSKGIFCTQCEAHGFHTITYFIDRPDVLTQFTTTINADKTKYPILLSNGNLIEKKDLPNNRHQVVWEDPTQKPAYLFALVAGDLKFIEDEYKTVSGRKIKLQIFAAKGLQKQCEFAMQSLKQAMMWDEKNFGFEYELDIYMIVAIDDFNVGAMENKGLNIFNSQYLLVLPEIATDDDYVNVAKVVAHEYFHNYRGNRITCRDWFQLSLKEGLTTFTDQTFVADQYYKSWQRIRAAKFIMTNQFAEDASPMAHPVRPKSYLEVNNFYTVTVYYKGAEIFHMLQMILGRENFRKTLETFATEFIGKTAIIEDLIAVAAKVAKINLQQFLQWFDKAGTPVLDIVSSYDVENKIFNLKVTQTMVNADANYSMHIPLAIGLIDANGQEIRLTENSLLQLKKPIEEFKFTNISSKPVLSLLRDFSAPVKVNYAYSEAELKFLMKHDQNDFGRWFAAQKLLTNKFFQLVKIQQENLELVLDQTFPEVFKTILHLVSENKIAFILAANILELPSENYILENMEVADVFAVHKVYEFLHFALASILKAEFLSCYLNLVVDKNYTLDANSIGRRSLKNLCLKYLMYLENDEVYSLAVNQYNNATNMTERLASLSSIANSKYLLTDQLLQDFYQTWQKYPQVVDKWFGINATIKFPNTLERVQKLLLHPKFNLANPNNVAALIISFCDKNLINFHNINGDGYEFLAKQVIELDAINPMIAAKLAKKLINWRKFTGEQQILMYNQLVKIMQLKDNLSENVYEVIEKSLKK